MPLIDHLKSLLPKPRLNVSKRFVLLREAISGTMSNFYMARDMHNGKIVGLKILDPIKTAAVEGRLHGLNKPSEGEIAMRLVHPRIVETYEFGMTTDDAPYLIMEYLEGPNLNTALAAHDPRLDGRRGRFVQQAAEAVAAVHAAGFIHRDICPRNLLMTNGGEDVKLIDFGLTVPATPEFMQPGNRTGTPNYMAPELVRRRPTDQRLDVFAFGVTAFEICTFELPWMRGTDGRAAMTHDKPPADVFQLRPQIHPQLGKAIQACIEPEISRRCPSIEQFLRMIRNVPESGDA